MSLKALLIRILNTLNTFKGKTNYRIVEARSADVTIAANGTSWVSVNHPDGCTPIAVVGYYLGGGSLCNVYNMTMASSGNASFALRNLYTSSQTTYINVQFLVIDQ